MKGEYSRCQALTLLDNWGVTMSGAIMLACCIDTELAMPSMG